MRPGDAVIVDTFDYFAMRYLAPHSDFALYAQNGRLDFFAGGTMAASDDRLVTPQQVERLSSRSWLADNMAMATITVPPSSKIRSQSTFGLLRVTEYEPSP